MSYDVQVQVLSPAPEMSESPQNSEPNKKGVELLGETWKQIDVMIGSVKYVNPTVSDVEINQLKNSLTQEASRLADSEVGVTSMVAVSLFNIMEKSLESSQFGMYAVTDPEQIIQIVNNGGVVITATETDTFLGVRSSSLKGANRTIWSPMLIVGYDNQNMRFITMNPYNQDRKSSHFRSQLLKNEAALNRTTALVNKRDALDLRLISRSTQRKPVMPNFPN